jgi:molecular chaperone GrpE
MKRKKRQRRRKYMDKQTQTQASSSAAEPEVNQAAQPDATAVNDNAAETAAEPAVAEVDPLEQAQQELEKQKKEYLFLMADFDNFRKRTLREKAELLRNGAEAAMKGLLPVIDDFERGLDALKNAADAEAVKEGMTLIYNKFVKYLEQNGVKPMESTGSDFNDELHEAVALVPGAEENRGKVIDTMQKGYMLNDKVLRHAKVAVGQ